MPQFQKGLIGRGARSSHRLGWIYIAGLAVWLLIGGYKGMPVWLDICIVLFSALLIWNSFRNAKKFKEASARLK
jgi:hypothetical protein